MMGMARFLLVATGRVKWALPSAAKKLCAVQIHFDTSRSHRLTDVRSREQAVYVKFGGITCLPTPSTGFTSAVSYQSYRLQLHVN
jgi:hypothetical protein